METTLSSALRDLGQLLPALQKLSPALQRLGDAMMACWDRGGKVLTCGNGGSATDAMHLATELSVRFVKNRKALAAVAMVDASALTAAGNDFGIERMFARQVEALGNSGDVLIVLSTSGDSANILGAIETAKSRGLFTAAFLGHEGGKCRGLCDVELIVPARATARIQEGHKILYHVLCEWVDAQVS
ncbi:MAG: D-sedoheptulose-7-phosphate isomerase [Tepidisphaeraceae bacterium]